MLKILILIFGIQIVYVSAFTLRMILTLKGQKYVAALISTMEVTIYVLGLNLVLSYLDHFASLAVYAIGYALGVLAGSWIEEKLALGYITLKVICNNPDVKLAQALRQAGYGVTSWLGAGRDGDRLVMEILAKRKNQKHLNDLILEHDPKAFVIFHEPNQIHGGFWTKAIKR
ncbi:DUF2179 domain-containing protein [Paenibacillus arenilitoris]|uniref:UPF0316 protein IDH41_17120 n=1 Tax=Paenibacillus arenilitoris TaxID=2772299 RepID=A0A927H757_9BACL|nr:DUF2179 domain-containing protein [Paenibacillus arenilitoris]MBD2870303.1 DUF2179 domain-containing protein [Paenibacillus arenilitoris]